VYGFHRFREREKPEIMLDPYTKAKIFLFLSETMFRKCHRQCHYNNTAHCNVFHSHEGKIQYKRQAFMSTANVQYN
jgi:hypothetical protein